MAVQSPVSPLDQAQLDRAGFSPVEEKQVLPSNYKHAINPALDGGQNKIPAGSEYRERNEKIPTSNEKQGRSARRRKRLIAAVVLVAVIFAISISVAVTQTRRAERSISNANDEGGDEGDSSTPQETDKGLSGPLKGTRLARQKRNCGSRHVLFYQDQGSNPRALRADINEEWQAPDPEPLPARNPMPATPLTGACVYTNGEDGQCYIFFVDNDRTIQGLRRSDVQGNQCTNSSWEQTNIGDMTYKVPSDTQITFAAIDTNNVNHARSDSDAVYGLILVATNPDGNVQEYRLDASKDTWTSRALPSSSLSGAYAGVDIDFYEGHLALFWLGPGNNKTLAYYNASDEDAWLRSTPSPPGPRALFNGSVCVEELFVVYQDGSGGLHGLDGFENNDDDGASDVDWSEEFSPGNDLGALNGTGLACLQDPSTEILFSALYQNVHGDLQEAYHPGSGEIVPGTAWIHRTILAAALMVGGNDS